MQAVVVVREEQRSLARPAHGRKNLARHQEWCAAGQMQGGVFVADEILAKHDENYMPREVADSLKEQGLYKGPNS